MASLIATGMHAQMRMWRGAQMWVGLWLMMSALTLLHAGALVNALYDVATAKVRCTDLKLLLYSALSHASRWGSRLTSTYFVLVQKLTSL